MYKTSTSVVYVSVWKKGNKTCVVHSERNEGDRAAKFWFTNYNPFPCFYMKSTYKCVSAWLTENGWAKTVLERASFTNDVIDDETGELIDHSVTVYITKQK